MDTDSSCAVAHGDADQPTSSRTLVAVFTSPVAHFLLRYGHDVGYRTVLVEPERGRIAADDTADDDVATTLPADLGDDVDVVVTDHHRAELGLVLRDALRVSTRWVGVLGNPHHPGPHLAALRDLVVSEEDIARVHRPIGLNIGSRAPAEIAIATLAGLIADRNGKPGGFDFPA